MSHLMLLGQAPARSGDGRPFSGPSGRRLCSLAGLDSYEDLAHTFSLRNLVPVVQEKVPGMKGDTFPLPVARRNAAQLMQDLPQGFVVICCGRPVSAMMGAPKRLYYIDNAPRKWGYRNEGTLAQIPHPSGVSRVWNDPEQVRKASDFLRWVIQQYGDA